eukprot:COSAG06_NODE_8187_length_2245_cov_2.190121_2_plen_174_part_00
MVWPAKSSRRGWRGLDLAVRFGAQVQKEDPGAAGRSRNGAAVQGADERRRAEEALQRPAHHDPLPRHLPHGLHLAHRVAGDAGVRHPDAGRRHGGCGGAHQLLHRDRRRRRVPHQSVARCAAPGSQPRARLAARESAGRQTCARRCAPVRPCRGAGADGLYLSVCLCRARQAS